jgi:hypothetical protein
MAAKDNLVNIGLAADSKKNCCILEKGLVGNENDRCFDDVVPASYFCCRKFEHPRSPTSANPHLPGVICDASFGLGCQEW